MSFEQHESLLHNTILDNFEIKGGWITDLSDLNKIEKFKYGTLKYSPTDIQMELFQGFPSKDEKSMSFAEDPQRYPIIYGHIANNSAYYVEAFNNSELSIPLMKGLAHVCTQKLNVSYFTVSNFSPLKNVITKDLILTSKFFNTWFSPQQKFVEFNQNNGFKIEVRNNGKKLLGSFEKGSSTFDVYLSGNVNRKCTSGARKIDLINDSFIKIRSNNLIDIKNAIKINEELSDLFSVIAAMPVNISLISLNGKGNLKKNIFYPNAVYPVIKEKNSFIFKSENIDFKKLIPNWFNKSEELKLLVDNYLLTIRYNDTIENKLINLTEGLESFYRNEHSDDGRNMTLLNIMENMVNAMPTFIKNKLNDEVGNIDNWLERLKNSRVFLAHGTERENRIRNTEELIIQVEIFQFIVQCFIMQKLGYEFDRSYDGRILSEMNRIFQTSFL